MHILAAFDKCKDSLSAREICSLAKEVVLNLSYSEQITTIPLTDGGEGFSELLTEAKNGQFHRVEAKDSLGREKAVDIGVINSNELNADLLNFVNLSGKGKMAVIEMSSIASLADLEKKDRNPWFTSTYGVGQLLSHSKALGADSILLGIGGSSTNDMGIGALSALGLDLFCPNGHPVSFPCPETWPDIIKIEAKNLLPLPSIRIACDVSNPLLGQDGATFQFGPQKGLPASRLNEMEEAMVKMSEALAVSFEKPTKMRTQEGAGAAGGIGYGLSLAYGAEFVPGFALTEMWFDLEKSIQKADLILTGEGRFDSTSLYGKGPYEIIRMASHFEKKVILLAGSVEQEAADKCKFEFPNVEIVPFGKENLSLNENLARASELFSEQLEKQLSRH